MKGCRRRRVGLAVKFHGWNSSFAPVPVPVPRKIAGGGHHRNPNLFLPLVLQLRSWANASVCLTYDSRPDCATDSAVNMIDGGPNVPDSLIDHVVENEISRAGICQYPNPALPTLHI